MLAGWIYIFCGAAPGSTTPASHANRVGAPCGLPTHFHQHRGWRLAVVLVSGTRCSLPLRPRRPLPQAADPVNLEQSQIFNDDLTVRSGPDYR